MEGRASRPSCRARPPDSPSTKSKRSCRNQSLSMTGAASSRLGGYKRHAPGSFHVPLREFQKSRPVRRGSVSSVVLPEAKVAIEQSGLDCRELGGPQVFLSEQSINRASPDFC